MTTMSIRIASRFLAVSTSVSPFCTALPDAATLTVSADRRFSANSKEMRVRVDASKKRLTMVLPRSAGTFLIGRSDTSLNGSAVSRTRRIWSAERCSSPIRSLPRLGLTPPPFAPTSPRHVRRALPRRRRPARPDPLSRLRPRYRAGSAARGRRGPRARTARSVWDARSRRARRAQRAPCGRVEHVIHDHDVLVGQVARDAGLADHGLGAHGFEVVAVQGDVEGAAGDEQALLLLDELGNPLGQLNAAALDADEDEIIGTVGQLEHFNGHTLKRPRQSAGVQDGGPFGPAHLRLGR